MLRVSVIIPVFNSERYLSQAIDSILCQTFGDFELLVLDDGSSDGSKKIAEQAAAKDSRVVFVKGDHHGVVHWRNAGVSMAKAELIAMMDSDDISLPDRLAKQVRYLDAHPECVAVGTQAIRVDEDGLPIDEWRVPEQHEKIDEFYMAGRAGVMVNPTVMMRKSAVVTIGGYRLGYDSAEDYDIFLRLAEIGRLANLPEVLLEYRLHAKSLTFARAEFQRRMAGKALEEAWVRRKRPDPLPAPLLELKAPSEEELMWTWAQNSFAARNFRTTRSHAFKLLRRRPSELRRWVLFGAACFGPLAHYLKRVLPYRVGSYRSPTPIL